jgi:hypothetical protein
MGQEDIAMKTLFKALLTAMLTLGLTGPAALAEERQRFTQAELDQMLAPIALYPDSLLAQILMAATYPLEVVQAARWSRANSYLAGEDAVRAVEPMDWDPSVKSLVAFPQILDRMDDQLDWTRRLGDAFIAQEWQVMDTIQDLRRRADAAGNLAPGEEMQVVHDDGYLGIEPASPQAIYVPYYDPLIVYGTWWWPAHRPVHWAPWPGHHVRKAYAPRYVWGKAVVFRTGFFFGSFSWPQRHVVIVHPKPANVIVHRQVGVVHSAPAPHNKPVRWKPDPRRRHGDFHARVPQHDSRPAHPVKTGDVLHLDGFGHVINPPRKDARVAHPAPPRRDAARRVAENKAASPKPGVSPPAPTTLRPRLIAAPLDAGGRVSTGADNPSPNLTPLQPHGIAAPLSAERGRSVRPSNSRPALGSSMPTMSRSAGARLR